MLREGCSPWGSGAPPRRPRHGRTVEGREGLLLGAEGEHVCPPGSQDAADEHRPVGPAGARVRACVLTEGTWNRPLFLGAKTT